MKKGDDIADDDDDAVARTSLSQDRVTATLRTEELFLRTQYIKLSPQIRRVKMWRGGGRRIQMVNTTNLVVPAGFHTSQLVLYAIYRISNKYSLPTIIL
jgi:hypothetical protein